MKGKTDFILYDFDGIIYRISDIESMYEQCKTDIGKNLKDLRWLYEYFHLQPEINCVFKLDCIVKKLASKISILAQIDSAVCIDAAVRNCRRLIYYWQCISPVFYSVNEQIYRYRNNQVYLVNKKRLVKKEYDCLLYAACFLEILQPTNALEQIESDKIFLHKNDYDYVKALWYVQNSFNIEIDNALKPNLSLLCHQLETYIRNFGAEKLYLQLVKLFSLNYNEKERRIIVSNSENVAFPALYHFTLKVLTEEKDSFESDQTRTVAYKAKEACGLQKVTENYIPSFQDILRLAECIVVLLDKNNEMNIGFIVKNINDSYLADLIAYSAIYDLHQCSFEGVLFLVKRIINAFRDKFEDKIGLSISVIIDIIMHMTEQAQTDFKNGHVTCLPMIEVNADVLIVLKKLASNRPLNINYLLPTDWDKVTDDSAWIIKKDEYFYVLPPVIPAWGIYDSINEIIGWPSNTGYILECAVHELFGQMNTIVYSGKYLLEEAESLIQKEKSTVLRKKTDRNKVYESDGLVLDSEHAIVLECKQKPFTRVARGGNQEAIIKDFVESYIYSQIQAFRVERAVCKAKKSVECQGMLAFYTGDEVNSSNIAHGKCSNNKTIANCKDIQCVLRLSCTAGNYWILGETGIVRKLEECLMKGLNQESGKDGNLEEFLACELRLPKGEKVTVEEYLKCVLHMPDGLMNSVTDYRNELKALYLLAEHYSGKGISVKTVKHTKKVVRMNHLFISFDKLYDIVQKLKEENRDSIGKVLLLLSRIQVKNYFTMNNIDFILKNI